MLEVVILIGLQASGKTTFFRQVLATTHAHVSKDNFPNNKRPQRRQLRLIADALAAGRHVVVDNTNPSPREWLPIMAIAREYGATIVGCWFPPDLPAAMARNSARHGRARVPDVGIHATVRNLRRPSLADGFDDLFTVRFDGDGGFEVQPWTECPPRV